MMEEHRQKSQKLTSNVTLLVLLAAVVSSRNVQYLGLLVIAMPPSLHYTLRSYDRIGDFSLNARVGDPACSLLFTWLLLSNR